MGFIRTFPNYSIANLLRSRLYIIMATIIALCNIVSHLYIIIATIIIALCNIISHLYIIMATIVPLCNIFSKNL